MNIGICDDEKVICEILCNHIQTYFKDSEQKGTIAIFTDGNQILKCITKLDIVFLDIDMPELDGIEVGKLIKKCHPKCKIIMATGKVERFKESFIINAFRFITKPFVYDEIKEALQAYEKEQIGNQKIAAYKERVEYGISQRDILYIRAYNGYVEIRTNYDVFRREKSLCEMEKIIDTTIFIRVSKQYLVNLLNVRDIHNGKIYMREIEIAIARRRKKEVEKKYVELSLYR